MKSEHLDALNRTAAANRIGEGTVQLIALAVRQHEDECHAPKAASIPQPQADAGDVREELVERAAEAAYERYRKGCKIKLPAWSECNDKDRWRGIARAAIAAVTYQTGGAK